MLRGGGDGWCKDTTIVMTSVVWRGKDQDSVDVGGWCRVAVVVVARKISCGDDDGR